MNARVSALFPALALLCSPAVAFAQQSLARLDLPVLVGPTNRQFAALVDFDGDGDDDVVGWGWLSATSQGLRLTGFRNDGTGALAVVWDVSFVPHPGNVADGKVRIQACDLDGDARGDFAVLAHGQGHASVHAFASSASGAPVEVPGYAFVAGPAASAIAAVLEDFDGDGVCDLALNVGTELRLHSFAPGAGGATGTLRATYALPAPADDLLLVDADGAGPRDLYANCAGTGRLVPVLAGFALGAATAFPHGIATMPMPIAGDVDADGDEDLVVFSMNTYVTLRRTGAATWSQEGAAAGGPATHLYDVDDDGDLDGTCCGGSGQPGIPSFGFHSPFRIALNDGGGGFAPAFDTPNMGSHRMAGASDLDGDGDLDLVAGRSVYFGRGPIRGPILPLAGTQRAPAAVVDFDEDGDKDFSVGYPTVACNLGTGMPDTVRPVFPAAPAGTIFRGPGIPGDYDGDGDVDLVVQMTTAGGLFQSTRLLANAGGGGFVDGGNASALDFNFGPSLDALNHPSYAVVADVDGDGDVDVAKRSTSTFETRFHWNDGAGTFAQMSAPVPGHLVAVADLDGDGLPDLVTTGLGGVGVQLGLGGGAFGSQAIVSSPLPVHFTGAALADLDGDTDLDIAFAPFGSTHPYPRPEVLWNDGQANFAIEPLTSTQVFSLALIAAADLDGDGLVDLVTGPVYGTGGVRVILRRPDNTGWVAAVDHAYFVLPPSGSGVLSEPVAIADVDGDGDRDLVGSHVARNVRWSGPSAGSREQEGSGLAGSGGFAPVLGASGPFRAGAEVVLRLAGSRPLASGVLYATWLGAGAAAPAGGPLARAAPQPWPSFFTTAGRAGVAGSGSWTQPFAVLPGMVGRTCVYTVEVDDPAASGGRSISNALRLTFGP